MTASTEADATLPAPRSAMWRWLWKPLITLLVLLAVLLGVVAAVWGLAHSEWATQRVLTSLSGVGVRVTAPQGALLGDFSAQRVEVDLPRGGLLRLEAPAWQGLTLVPDMTVGWLTGVQAKGLQVQQVHLNWVAGPPSATPLQAPSNLSLPMSVRMGRVQVAEFVSNLVGEQPVKGLDVGLALQEGLLPTRHRIRLDHLAWGDWQVQGQANVGVRGRMAVDASLRASGAVTSDLAGQAEVALKGALTDLGVKAQARLQRGEQRKQAVEIDAQLQAFAPWPLSRLKAHLDQLNLADLHAGLPRTALQGNIDIEPDDRGAQGKNKNKSKTHPDLQARVALNNSLSGPWDQQRLPVRDWQGVIRVAKAVEARSLDDLLASVQVDWQLALPRVRAGESAQVKLSGGWGQGRSLKLVLNQLEPQALHTQAPPLQLQGELSLAPVSSPAGVTPSWRETVATLVAKLTGEHGRAHAVPDQAKAMSAGARPVKADLEARYAPGVVSVTRLSLASGEASAVLSDAQWRWPQAVPVPVSVSASVPSSASASASGASQPESASPSPALPAWQSRGQLVVRSFDPQLWLPWPAEASGRNELSAQVKFELDAAWRGSLSAQLAPSWLAGVPLKGDVQWQSPRNKQVMSLNLNLDAAGNEAKAQMQLPWQLNATGLPQLTTAAQWQAQVNATTLATLQPLATLVGAKQLSGAVSVNTHGQGLWPRVTSKGQAHVSGLRWQPKEGEGVTVASVQADWGVETRGPNSPVKAQIDVRQLKAGTVELVDASLRLNGSVQAHQGQLHANVVRKTPPQTGAKAEAVDGDANANAKSETEKLTLDLALQGGLTWTDASHVWKGLIQDVVVRLGESPGREALRLQPTALQWRQDERTESVTVGTTRLNVMGAVLHLRQAAWTWADRQRDPVGVAQLDMDLEEFNLPQLLAQWQPKAGWGGDLILQGDVKVRHSRQAPWVVDATVQRKSGDISLSEPTIEGNSAQRLGIREVRVNLQARDGVWTLSELMEGRALGKLVGRQVVKAEDPLHLPQGSDALRGELDLTIDNLRPWGTWIPAGWRVSGKVMAEAELTGTLGAPRYSGQVLGENLGAGQALMGVNLSDGKLQMSLLGDLVVLQHFEARGGAAGGLITAQGQATFGDLPQARLSLTAERFPLLQRVDRRLMVSGVVNAALGTDMMEATGQVRVDEGLIDISKSSAPTVGDDVTVINRPANARPVGASNGNGNGNGSSDGPRREPKRKLMANLDVDLGHNLRIKGMGLDAILAGVLKVTTPSNRPSLYGTVRVEKGTYAAYGQKLLVDRGTVAFTGAVENPRLDILAMRAQSPTARNSDVKVGVAITGTAQDPRIRLYSDPSMTETEKLSWLVLGRAPTGLGGADIGLLQTAAVALLAGEDASPSDNLIGLLGLDEFSVRQTDGSVRETVINVGKQVSRNWYVGYEHNLNATGGNWQLIYTLARRFTLRLQAGADNAADLIWSWRWD